REPRRERRARSEHDVVTPTGEAAERLALPADRAAAVLDLEPEPASRQGPLRPAAEVLRRLAERLGRQPLDPEPDRAAEEMRGQEQAAQQIGPVVAGPRFDAGVRRVVARAEGLQLHAQPAEPPFDPNVAQLRQLDPRKV